MPLIEDIECYFDKYGWRSLRDLQKKREEILQMFTTIYDHGDWKEIRSIKVWITFVMLFIIVFFYSKVDN